MSMCTCSNRSSGDGKGSTGVCVRLSTLAFWQCSQVLTHSRISDFIRGQTYLCVSSLMEALAPGWDRLWRLEKKICRNDSGTNGRIFPVLMTYTMSWLLLETRTSVGGKIRPFVPESFRHIFFSSLHNLNLTNVPHDVLVAVRNTYFCQI